VNGGLPPLLRFYRGGLYVLEPAAAGLLAWRRRKGKEDGARLAERRGIAGRGRPDGPLAWVHGASIGETLAVLPVVERLTQAGLSVLVTSGTRAAAEVVARRLPPGAFHQYVPLDLPRYVRRFLDHWRPDLALVAESELWPNIILGLERRGVPLVLVNGRLSERSFRRWRRMPEVARALMGRFALCLAQTPADAERLRELGAPAVAEIGNLKFDASPPPADPRAVAHLQAVVAGRPVWVAASTHPGEEELVVAAHHALQSRFPRLLTVIAPRHARRGVAIAALAAETGLGPARRSEGAEPDRKTNLYVADTSGELGLFYRLSSLVLMGGSLVPHGGQNPIEPAKLGAAILHGPHVHNFADIYAAIDGAGGALPVADGERLTHSLADLLPDTGLQREMARAGADAVGRLGGAVERTMHAVEPLVARAKGMLS
jgi:3-deoxy-D-manno-octulosonic-acid transferase